MKLNMMAKSICKRATMPACSRGGILIIAIGTMLALSGLVLVFARQIQVELLVSGNLEAELQADAIVRGAAAHVLNQLVTNKTVNFATPSQIDIEIQSEAVALGDGHFWILRPNPDDEHQYAFGVVDESSKLNINNATSSMLALLPGITPELADSIVEWHSNPGTGADDNYYLQLREPYTCKHSSFETLGEMRLVKGATADILFGVDTNHNGVAEPDELQGKAYAPSLNGQMQCGIMKYLTVYSKQPNTASSGQPKFPVGDISKDGLDRLGNWLSSLPQPFAHSRILAIQNQLRAGVAPNSVLDFYFKSGMTIDEFKRIENRATTSPGPAQGGLINVNTAPREVLRCLPGLDSGDIERLIAARANTTNLGDLAWVAQILSAAKARAVGGHITVRSYQYSADIVGVSGNGKGFKRCRYVFDLRFSPARVILRQDLTYLGWPLSAELRENLRSGLVASATASNFSLGGAR